jgi:hypothetical protein
MKLRTTLSIAALALAASDANAAKQCLPCSAGSYSNSSTGSSCRTCAAGYYQNEAAQGSCKACPAGQYQDTTGQINCKACAAGYYQNAAGKASCTACPAGQYQPNAGQVGCAGCAGTVYNNMQSCCTQYWNGSSCVAWVNCGANATRQSNNTCSCNGGYNYNGGSGVPAGVACVQNCVQTGWAYTGTKVCSSVSSNSGDIKTSKPDGAGRYCYCQQTRNSCGTGANEQWVSRGDWSSVYDSCAACWCP